MGDAGPGERDELHRLTVRLAATLDALDSVAEAGADTDPDPVVAAVDDACAPSLDRLAELLGIVRELTEAADDPTAHASADAALRALAERRPGDGPR